MPLILQLQVWFCFGPFLAAAFLLPTIIGSRPVLLTGTPAVYFYDTAHSVEHSESVSQQSVEAASEPRALRYEAVGHQADVVFSGLCRTANNAANPCSPRAP